MEQKIIIAGGSGFLGRLAAEYFQKRNWQVVLLSRKQAVVSTGTNIKAVWWDGQHVAEWKQELEGAAVLLNLSGRSVDCRYTARAKREIYASRLDSTRCLAMALSQCSQAPPLWINASSATIYRHSYEPQDEESGQYGEGFSVDVCQQWEKAFFEKPLPHVRKVALRLGIVLGKGGSALAPLTLLTRSGFGKRFGPGTQYISWLHQQDYLRILQFIIDTPTVEGAINATAPNPIPNQQFLARMRDALGISLAMPLPAPLLEMGAFLIRTETELILKSRCVVPRRLQQLGFRFKYPESAGALAELLSKEPKALA